MADREKLDYCREVIATIRDSYKTKVKQLSTSKSVWDNDLVNAFKSEVKWLNNVLKDTQP